ncbi:MAG: ABC transporter ATP-binding protein [Chloroflexota bacterium]
MEVVHVGLRLGGRDVLSEVTFALERGEFLGILGSNGAGKSTLLRLILGLLRPDRGAVRVLGRPARGGNIAVGYVPQQNTLPRDLPLRARDFVRLGLDGARWGMPLPDRSIEERVQEALEAVGAAQYAEAPVGRLSGGEQQRLYLAQALVGRPSLLLLDEPLSNLDLRSRRDVVALVRQVSKDRDIAVVFVAHDINPLLGALDRVLYLAGGRSVSGTVDEVIQSDVLTALYGFPVTVVRAQGHVLVVGAGEGDDCHA